MKGGKEIENLKNLANFEKIVPPVVKTINENEEKKRTGVSSHDLTIQKSTKHQIKLFII